MNTDVTIESQIINATIETEGTSKKYRRLVIKKFLHKSELKEYYKVLSDNEDTLKIKKKLEHQNRRPLKLFIILLVIIFDCTH